MVQYWWEVEEQHEQLQLDNEVVEIKLKERGEAIMDTYL
jgi:hypothetical protein